MTAELFLWKMLCGMAEDAYPPASFARFDEQYRGTRSLSDSAASDIAQGLKTSDEQSASTRRQDAVEALQGLDISGVSATPAAAIQVP